MGAKIGVVGKVRMGWSFKEIGLGQKTFFFSLPLGFILLTVDFLGKWQH